MRGSREKNVKKSWGFISKRRPVCKLQTKSLEKRKLIELQSLNNR